MKILIATPFFSNLGGSELETIFTANYFSSLKNVDKVVIYVEGVFDLEFCKNIYINKKIVFLRKPLLLRYNFIRLISKKIRDFYKLDYLAFELFFWKTHLLLSNYKCIYIFTKSSLNYYIPIIKNYKNHNKIFVKYITVFYKSIPIISLKYLKLICNNIVTSQKQVDFFKNKLKLENTISSETLIYNEFKDIDIIAPSLKEFDFGVFSRISREKQIEDSIYLIGKLKSKGYIKTLYIKGSGVDKVYYRELLKLISELNIANQITFDYTSLDYNKVDKFFRKIKFVIITSSYEGGPTVALESMAFGVPVLSYDVGAMMDRLKEFPQLIVNEKPEFIEKAIDLLNLDDKQYLNLCVDIKNYYKMNLNNNIVETFLKKITI